MTLDSLPFAARVALRSDARAFVPYAPTAYDQRFIRDYPFSRDNGMYVIRANLQGFGPTDYVVAGRSRGQRAVMAVMRRRRGGIDWIVRNVTAGEIGLGVPEDSASMLVRRGERAHPNGEWDAIIVKRVYARTADSVATFYWDPTRDTFYSRGRRQ